MKEIKPKVVLTHGSMARRLIDKLFENEVRNVIIDETEINVLSVKHFKERSGWWSDKKVLDVGDKLGKLFNKIIASLADNGQKSLVSIPLQFY